MPTFRYSILQYVPDPVREERLNVGVVVAGSDSPFFGSKLLGSRDIGRLKRMGFGTQFGFLQELARGLAASACGEDQLQGTVPGPWNVETLASASRDWANTIRLTAPRGVVHDRPDVLVDLLFQQLVADPAAPRRRARDRRWIQGHVARSIRKALVDAHPDVAVAEHLQRNVIVHGRIESHKFDFRLVNGRPLQLIHSLAAEGGEQSSLRTQIDALAWAIDDVRKADAEIPLTVLTIGDDPLLDLADRVYDSLGAQMVREDQLEPWLDTAATRLTLALSDPS